MRPLAVSLAALALGCGPGTPPTLVTLSFERDAGRDDGVRAVELDVIGAVAFLDAVPSDPGPRAPCVVQGGVRLPLASRVRVDLTGGGRTPIGTVDAGAGGTLTEIRLLVGDAEVEVSGARRPGVGRLTCVDGALERIVFRLQPDDPIPVDRGRHDLVAEFHAHGDVTQDGGRFLLGRSYPLALAP